MFGEPTAVETLLMACPDIARRDAFPDTGEGVFHGVDDRLDGAVRRVLLHYGTALLRDLLKPNHAHLVHSGPHHLR